MKNLSVLIFFLASTIGAWAQNENAPKGPLIYQFFQQNKTTKYLKVENFINFLKRQEIQNIEHIYNQLFYVQTTDLNPKLYSFYSDYKSNNTPQLTINFYSKSEGSLLNRIRIYQISQQFKISESNLIYKFEDYFKRDDKIAIPVSKDADLLTVAKYIQMTENMPNDHDVSPIAKIDSKAELLSTALKTKSNLQSKVSSEISKSLEAIKSKQKLLIEKQSEAIRLWSNLGKEDGINTHKNNLISLLNLEKKQPQLLREIEQTLKKYEQYQKKSFIKLDINMDTKPKNIAFLIDRSGSISSVINVILAELSMIIELLPAGSVVSVYQMTLDEGDEPATIIENVVLEQNTDRQMAIIDVIKNTKPLKICGDAFLPALKKVFRNTAAQEVKILTDTQYYEYYRFLPINWESLKNSTELHENKIKQNLKIDVFNFGVWNHITNIDNSLVNLGKTVGKIYESHGVFDIDTLKQTYEEVVPLILKNRPLIVEYMQLRKKIPAEMLDLEQLKNNLTKIMKNYPGTAVQDFVKNLILELGLN